MKSISLGIGDKVVNLNTLIKERRKDSQENHKALMETLAGIEQVLVKQQTMAMPAVEMGVAPPAPSEAIPVMSFYGQNAAPHHAAPPQMAKQHLQAAPMAPPSGFPPSPAYGVPAATTRSASMSEAVNPPPLVEVTPDAVGLPAAFVRKGPGYANARRAWKVVVQGAHGQSRVRAVSPNCIRVNETPPANWIQEFGLGSITVG